MKFETLLGLLVVGGLLLLGLLLWLRPMPVECPSQLGRWRPADRIRVRAQLAQTPNPDCPQSRSQNEACIMGWLEATFLPDVALQVLQGQIPLDPIQTNHLQTCYSQGCLIEFLMTRTRTSGVKNGPGLTPDCAACLAGQAQQTPLLVDGLQTAPITRFRQADPSLPSPDPTLRAYATAVAQNLATCVTQGTCAAGSNPYPARPVPPTPTPPPLTTIASYFS